MEFILIFVLFMCRLAKYFSDYFFVIRLCYNIRSCQKVVYYGHNVTRRSTLYSDTGIEHTGAIGVMLERSGESQVVTQSPKNRITIHYKKQTRSVQFGQQRSILQMNTVVQFGVSSQQRQQSILQSNSKSYLSFDAGHLLS